jgi:hypothetical protein
MNALDPIIDFLREHARDDMAETLVLWSAVCESAGFREGVAGHDISKGDLIQIDREGCFRSVSMSWGGPFYGLVHTAHTYVALRDYAKGAVVLGLDLDLMMPRPGIHNSAPPDAPDEDFRDHVHYQRSTDDTR